MDDKLPLPNQGITVPTIYLLPTLLQLKVSLRSTAFIPPVRELNSVQERAVRLSKCCVQPKFLSETIKSPDSLPYKAWPNQPPRSAYHKYAFLQEAVHVGQAINHRFLPDSLAPELPSGENGSSSQPSLDVAFSFLLAKE